MHMRVSSHALIAVIATSAFLLSGCVGGTVGGTVGAIMPEMTKQLDTSMTLVEIQRSLRAIEKNLIEANGKWKNAVDKVQTAAGIKVVERRTSKCEAATRGQKPGNVKSVSLSRDCAVEATENIEKIKAELKGARIAELTKRKSNVTLLGQAAILLWDMQKLDRASFEEGRKVVTALATGPTPTAAQVVKEASSINLEQTATDIKAVAEATYERVTTIPDFIEAVAVYCRDQNLLADVADYVRRMSSRTPNPGDYTALIEILERVLARSAA